MSCHYGHSPWHYHGYPCGPPAYASPSPMDYPPDEPYGYGRRRRRRARAEELADYLRELEAEIAHIRRELDELRANEHNQS